jgi:hypothetical protein
MAGCEVRDRGQRKVTVTRCRASAAHDGADLPTSDHIETR